MTAGIETDGLHPEANDRRIHEAVRAEPTHFFMAPSGEHLSPDVEGVVQKRTRVTGSCAKEEDSARDGAPESQIPATGNRLGSGRLRQLVRMAGARSPGSEAAPGGNRTAARYRAPVQHPYADSRPCPRPRRATIRPLASARATVSDPREERSARGGRAETSSAALGRRRRRRPGKCPCCRRDSWCRRRPRRPSW